MLLKSAYLIEHGRCGSYCLQKIAEKDERFQTLMFNMKDEFIEFMVHSAQHER